ncbi:MAG: hypothetical protein M1819_000809 [Sarea resinae]|nr:MAG: hypothetical protein M1819_000809 [Sarea resinae]
MNNLGTFGIGVEIDWSDIIGKEKTPTEVDLKFWGGDMKQPGFVVQKIKTELFPARRWVRQRDAMLEIVFAMAKGETSEVVGEHIELPFSPHAQYEWVEAIRINLNTFFTLPNKKKMFDYSISFFEDGSKLKFRIRPDSPWAKKAMLEKGVEHFYEGCFDDIIDGAMEEPRDAPELQDGPIWRGQSVFSDDDDPASNNDEPASSNGNLTSNNNNLASSNGNLSSSNDNPAPNTPDAAGTQQRTSSHLDTVLESVVEAEQSNLLTYPAAGGVLSGKIVPRSDDDEVNDMIVNAEFGDPKDGVDIEDIRILGTSVWPTLVGSDGQDKDLAEISLPDESFNYGSAVIPNPSDNLPEIPSILERLHTFLLAVAQARRGVECIAKGGTVSLKVPTETLLHGLGLQVIESVDFQNAQPGLQPGAKRTSIEAKYRTAYKDLYSLLHSKVILLRLANKRVYFVNP